MKITADDIMQQARWPGMCWKDPENKALKETLQTLRINLVASYLENSECGKEHISFHVHTLAQFMQTYAWFAEPEFGVRYAPYKPPTAWAPSSDRQEPSLYLKGHGAGKAPSADEADSWAKRHITAIADAIDALQTGKTKWQRRDGGGLQL